MLVVVSLSGLDLGWVPLLLALHLVEEAF